MGTRVFMGIDVFLHIIEYTLSFKVPRSSIKRLVAWKWRAFTLSFEISLDMYLFSYVYKKRFVPNRAWTNPIWMPICCLTSELPTIKEQFCIRCSKEVLNVLLQKATFSPVYNIILGNRNLCSIFTFKKKINNITQLSWRNVVYEVLKSYVAKDLAFFFLFMMLIFLMTGSTFWTIHNLW